MVRGPGGRGIPASAWPRRTRGTSSGRAPQSARARRWARQAPGDSVLAGPVPGLGVVRRREQCPSCLAHFSNPNSNRIFTAVAPARRTRRTSIEPNMKQSTHLMAAPFFTRAGARRVGSDPASRPCCLYRYLRRAVLLNVDMTITCRCCAKNGQTGKMKKAMASRTVRDTPTDTTPPSLTP